MINEGPYLIVVEAAEWIDNTQVPNVFPKNWRDNINLDKLCMMDPTTCVFAQGRGKPYQHGEWSDWVECVPEEIYYAFSNFDSAWRRYLGK